MTVKKLFLIDAMAMAFRSYHAMGARPLMTSKGLPTSAVYGSLTILMKIMEEEKPDYLVIACDSREQTFRHVLFNDYKAHRVEFPEDLSVQMPSFFRLFDALGLRTLKVPGFEADDIIGSLVTQLASPELHCYIVSGDKDFMQLIDGNVFIYAPQKGGAVKILDQFAVFEKFGCKPEQVVDVLALMGDASDNVPGVRGVGEKGAIKLIQDFHSLDQLYSRLEEVPNPRQKEALRGHKTEAYLSQELVTIKKDIDLGIQLVDMACQWQESLRSANMRKFLEEMEFRTIIKRIDDNVGFKLERKTTKPTSVPIQKTLTELLTRYGVDSQSRHYLLVNSRNLFSNFLTELRQASEFALDTETTGLDSQHDRPIGLSFGLGGGRAFYVPLLSEHLVDLVESEILEELRPILLDPHKNKIIHNIKFDLQMLRNIKVTVTAPLADTMLASFLLDSTGNHGLDSLSRKLLNVEKIPTSELMGPKKDIPMAKVDLELLSYYACEDADCCFRLHQILLPKLQEKGMEKLYQEVEVPLAQILADMEQKGIYVNVETLRVISEHLKQRLGELEVEIFKLAGEEFNLNSPKQLQVILFEKLKVHELLGIKKIKKTKSGLSTDVSVLETLVAHPLVGFLLEYRTLSKLKSTYTDTLPEVIDRVSGRIHTSFHQTGTATGRLSSSNPNLQNIPIRSDVGQKIRTAFEGQGDCVLLSADYSQIELRLLAHITGDKNLRAAFLSGKDVHSATAAMVFGKSLDEISSEERSQAKAVNYGVAYGMGPHRFAETTGLSIQTAKAFIAKYFETFPRIREYIDEAVTFAIGHGYSQTLLGRRRIIDVSQQSGMAWANAKNIAVNAPIQGTAADLIKLAMIRIDREIKRQGLSARMLLQIHDELVFECVQGELPALKAIVKEGMENAMDLSVPLTAEMGYGKNWYEAHH